LTVDDPDVGHHSFVYDVTGNLIEHHKPDGTVTKSAFDLGGRPVSEDWNGDGTPEVIHTWDTSARHPNDPLYAGKLVTMTDPSGSIENEYDARQRVVATRQTIDGHTYESATVFDDRDREALHTFPDGSSLRLYFNPRGQVSGYGKAVSLSYDGDGVELTRSFNTGVVATTSYDDDRRRTEVRATDAQGTALQDLVWTYDEAGNIATIADHRAVDAAHDRSETYTLDNLYRLIGAKGSWGSASWAYSPTGNLIARTSTVASLNAGTMTYGGTAGPHALTGFGGRAIRYDALGRMTSDGDRSYTWDDNDRLVHVASSNGASVDSVFDGAGMRRLRVETTSDGATHRTVLLDPWSEVRDGTLVRFIVHEGRRIAQLSANTGAPAQTGAVAGGPTADDEGEQEPPGSRFWKRVGETFSMQCIALALLGVLLVHFRRRVWSALRWAAVPLAFAALAMACKGNGGSATNLDGSILTLTSADELLFDDGIGTLTEETGATGAARATFATYP
jgi:YD repeat-containing protein